MSPRSLPASSVSWSSNGELLAAVTADQVTVTDFADSGKARTNDVCHVIHFGIAQLSQEHAWCGLQGRTLKLPLLVAVAFSAENAFLQTFQRPQKEAGNADKNLKVPFHVCFFSFSQTHNSP